MYEKYYTHFLLSEPNASTCGEFRGVVEISRISSDDLEQAEVQRILADNFDVDAEEVTIIDWSRLH
ncbi:MAG: hypothetical protein AAFN78_17055 [Pseudomonadota bacterium]